MSPNTLLSDCATLLVNGTYLVSFKIQQGEPKSTIFCRGKRHTGASVAGGSIRMKTVASLFLVMVAGCAAIYGEKANDTVTITTTPPGATVEWNRKAIGVTPLTYKVGEYAFNARKSSVFSKRLAQPVNLHITLPGFNAVDVTITGPPLFWTSLNRQNGFTYYVIGLQDFNFKMDKVSAAPKTMSNTDVVELHTAGFGDDLIIDKINTTSTAFKLEVSDMVELRRAGVSDVVIQVMMKKSTAP